MQRIPVFSAAGEAMGTVPANVVAIYGPSNDPALIQLARELRAAGDLPRFRNSKFFNSREIAGRFDVVVIDDSAPNAQVVRGWFAGTEARLFTITRNDHGVACIPAEVTAFIADSSARTAKRP